MREAIKEISMKKTCILCKKPSNYIKPFFHHELCNKTTLTSTKDSNTIKVNTANSFEEY